MRSVMPFNIVSKLEESVKDNLQEHEEEEEEEEDVLE